MDVQGTQFHLLHGAADWERCVDSQFGRTIGELQAELAEGLPSTDSTDLEVDAGTLRLRRDLPLFRRSGRRHPLDPDSRRGAGVDAYGNWFWIAADRRSLRWRPADEARSSTWWSVADLVRSCAGSGPEGADFTARTAVPAPPVRLQGLAVTSRHLLLVGYREPSESGLLVFDLQSGSPPLRMRWPTTAGADPARTFDPWDLVGTADGGALVLDQTNLMYWVLDDRLRVRGRSAELAAGFQPVDPDPAAAIAYPGPTQPLGTPIAGPGVLAPIHPVSIEPGPDGTVLILDTDGVRGFSRIHQFDGDDLVWTVWLDEVVEVDDPEHPDDPVRYSLVGHDFTYGPGPVDDDGTAPALFYVADQEGKQVVALELVEPGPDEVEPPGPLAVRRRRMVARKDFLPLRRWDGLALVAAAGEVWYDFDERWVPLAVLTECRFRGAATFTTPTGFDEPLAVDPSGGSVVPRPAGAPFDSRIPGCVWHRLLLDAEIPNGTLVGVRARAADDPALLPFASWRVQPSVYQRSGGPELPWYDPWAARRSALAPGAVLPDRLGTWELLFQQVVGRYVEIEVTVEGTGRSTPVLTSLRAWFPRFSYRDHYLPAVYGENDSADAFLDRFLANFEGSFTALEEKIEHAHLLLDARTTPTSDLPWLAAWFGLALDRQWDENSRRFLIRHVDRFYRLRGTLAGLVSTLRVYLRPLLVPLDAAPVALDDSVFDPPGAGADVGGVHVVERFLTRAAPPDPGGTGAGARDLVAGAAHRFDVWVPAALGPDGLAMVQRIVETAKPAHTWFELRPYDELFVIGRARLGLDTELGDAPLFRPVVLGREPLIAGGYLGYPRPFDIADRVVVDRDAIQNLPAL